MAFFEPLPQNSQDKSVAEVKKLNNQFLSMVLVPSAEGGGVPLEKFFYYYDNVIPAKYRLTHPNVGTLVSSLFSSRKRRLSGESSFHSFFLCLFFFFFSFLTTCFNFFFICSNPERR